MILKAKKQQHVEHQVVPVITFHIHVLHLTHAYYLTVCGQFVCHIFLQGQCARLCMVLQAITNATTGNTTLIIEETTARQAVLLARSLLEHKMALITDVTDAIQLPVPPVLSKEDLVNQRRKVARALTEPMLTARQVFQKRFTPGKTRSMEDAKSLLETLATNGFGEVVQGRNNSISLKRKRFEEMAPVTQALFYELEVDKATYERMVEDEVPSKRGK